MGRAVAEQIIRPVPFCAPPSCAIPFRGEGQPSPRLTRPVFELENIGIRRPRLVIGIALKAINRPVTNVKNKTRSVRKPGDLCVYVPKRKRPAAGQRGVPEEITNLVKNPHRSGLGP